MKIVMARARARHILVNTEEDCMRLKREILEGLDFADAAKRFRNVLRDEKEGTSVNSSAGKWCQNSIRPSSMNRWAK